MKISELTGTLLNYWVAKTCEGPDIRAFHLPAHVWSDAEVAWVVFEPSHNWAHGGPIIARERIALVCTRPRHDTNDGEHWDAVVNGDYVGPDGQVESRNRGAHADGDGPTPLIAAMRACVASKFGSEVPGDVLQIPPMALQSRAPTEQ